MDLAKIKFQTGVMRAFTATRSFSIGPMSTPIQRGEQMLFDGSTVDFRGSQFPFPQLRGALKADWIVFSEQFNEDDFELGRPQSANIQVRHPTQGGNPMQPQAKTAILTTQSDERVVGNAVNHAASTRQGNGFQQRMAVSGVEPQDGVPVRQLKTLAGEKARTQRTMLTGDSVGNVLREANASGRIDPQEGITEEQMLERMAPEDQEAYLADKTARKSKYVEVDSTSTRVASLRNPTPKPQQSEGVSIKTTVGGGTEVADYAGTGVGGKVKEGVIVEDGMTFRTTNGPDKSLKPSVHPRSEEARQPVMVRDGTEDIRRSLAKRFCPDFPDNYNFSDSPRKKLARLTADYEDREDVLQAVFMAEGDEFKALLAKEFPQFFSAA